MSGLITALLLFSAFGKLMMPEMVEMMAKFGLGDWVKIIAVGELVSAVLFIIPKTSSLGVLLLSAHLGGAIATHMGNGEPFVMQTVILLLIWVANYLRNPEMFCSFTK